MIDFGTAVTKLDSPRGESIVPQFVPRLSHKKLTCLSVEIKVSGESINLSIQA